MKNISKKNQGSPLKKTRRRAYQVLEEEETHTKVIEPKTVISTVDDKQAVSANKAYLIRQKEAEKIVVRAMWLARGVGVIPIPMIDFVALNAIQMTMLAQLSYLYGVNFSKDRTKKIIISLSSSTNTALIGGFVIYNLGRLIPGLGTIGGLLTMPLIGGSLTYAVGKTFIKHYELGGTLLDFNPQNTREYFQTQFQQGNKLKT